MKPSIEEMKVQAKRLREALSKSGNSLNHSQSLEMIAKQHGFRDWNTAHAAAGNRPDLPKLGVGQTVSGRYLGQPFKAEIIGLRAYGPPGSYRITLELEEPVDVVTFESFSAYRRRISANIGPDLSTTEKTSNGLPQMVLEP